MQKKGHERLLKLFYSSEIDKPGCDLDGIFSLLDRLKEAGVCVELVDTAKMNDRELHEFYTTEAVYPTHGRHYRIGQIFGTRRKTGVFFGKEQPALLVYEKGAERPTDIFPHTIKGQRITIEEFLREKISEADSANGVEAFKLWR